MTGVIIVDQQRSHRDKRRSMAALVDETDLGTVDVSDGNEEKKGGFDSWEWHYES